MSDVKVANKFFAVASNGIGAVIARGAIVVGFPVLMWLSSALVDSLRAELRLQFTAVEEQIKPIASTVAELKIRAEMNRDNISLLQGDVKTLHEHDLAIDRILDKRK